MTVTRIGELDCRIRARGGDLRGQALAARLDRLARDGLGPSVGQALARDVASDPTYAVVAEVDVALRLRASDDDLRSVSDQHILRTWSGELAAAVREQLRSGREIEGVKVFADEPTFLASFLVAVLDDRAWPRWYYGSLERHRKSDPAATALEVLRARPEIAGATLATLDSLGALVRLLDLLGPDARRTLWRILLEANGVVLEEVTQVSQRPAEVAPVDGAGASPPSDSWHPLLIVAWRIAARLGLIAAGAPPRATLLALTGRMPSFVDWQDSASLSDGVLEALRLLAEAGAVRAPGDAIADGSELEAAIAGLAWLDRSRLVESLRTWRSGGVDRSERPPPRIRRLLDDLAATVATIEGDSSGRLDLPGLKLLLLARLQAGSARWRAGELAARVVDQLVRIAARSTSGGLRAHEPGLGEPGTALVHRLAALLRSAKPSPPATIQGALPSAGAGVLLLVRALVDGRLDQRLTACGADEAERRWILHGIACALSGLGKVAADDPALEWLAGAGPTAGDLPQVSPMVEVTRGLALDLPILAGWLRTELVALRLGEGCLVADPDGNVWLPERRPRGLAAILDEVVRRNAPGGAAIYLDPSLEDALEPSDLLVRVERGTPARTRERVCEALGAFGADPQAVSFDHLAAYALANMVLRAWASWLRGFERSSVRWLLTQLVRRPGLLRTAAGGADVWLEPRPLDLVLRRAGYLDSLALPAWLGGGALSIHTLREDA